MEDKVQVRVRVRVRIKKVAQASASSLPGGLFQRQIVLQAAPSSGQPQPTSRLGRINAGTQAMPGVFSTLLSTSSTLALRCCGSPEMDTLPPWLGLG